MIRWKSICIALIGGHLLYVSRSLRCSRHENATLTQTRTRTDYTEIHRVARRAHHVILRHHLRLVLVVPPPVAVDRRSRVPRDDPTLFPKHIAVYLWQEDVGKSGSVCRGGGGGCVFEDGDHAVAGVWCGVMRRGGRVFAPIFVFNVHFERVDKMCMREVPVGWVDGVSLISFCFLPFELFVAGYLCASVYLVLSCDYLRLHRIATLGTS